MDKRGFVSDIAYRGPDEEEVRVTFMLRTQEQVGLAIKVLLGMRDILPTEREIAPDRPDLIEYGPFQMAGPAAETIENVRDTSKP